MSLSTVDQSRLKRLTDNALSEVDAYVARVQRGDSASFRPVVDATLGVVRALVVSRSLPGVDVDDVVQRTFVEAYKNIGDYEVGTAFSSWVLTIARYQLLRETTRLRRQADYHSRFVPHAVAAAVETRVEQRLGDEADARLEHLRECLEHLSESAREVLRYRYEGGDSIGEIAEAVSRTPGAVRKQLCLLRKQLHDCVTLKLGEQPSAVLTEGLS